MSVNVLDELMGCQFYRCLSGYGCGPGFFVCLFFPLDLCSYLCQSSTEGPIVVVIATNRFLVVQAPL